MSSETRFLSKINKEGPIYKNLGNCWEWTGTTNDDNYGYFTHKGIRTKSHRFSWEYFRDSIPKDLKVLHKCDNPLCVNPDHLFLGTQKDNIRDAINKSRFKGVFILPKKLTKEKVKEIRELYKTENYTQKEIAKKYNVSQGTICAIINNKYWKDI